MIKLKFLFNSTHIFVIYFLSFRFSECLFSSLVFMTNNENFLLNSRFQIKDKINKKHKHDLIYYTKCPEAFCTEEYLGETGRRIIAGIADHTGKDKQSHLLKHALS